LATSKIPSDYYAVEFEVAVPQALYTPMAKVKANGDHSLEILYCYVRERRTRTAETPNIRASGTTGAHTLPKKEKHTYT